MKEFNLDLQLHGVYAGGVSKNMLVPIIAEQAKLKGIDAVSTADILHKKWFEHVKQGIVEESNGVFSDKNSKCFFVVGTGVESKDRAHHLIYLPDFSAAEQLREKLIGFGNPDCAMCGRPVLRLNAEQIAENVEEAKGIIGPAHSFTPYTGIYAHHDSVRKAYGGMAESISFIELGLSADSALADLIEENHSYSFLTSSDAHSPWPHRIGREFTRMKLKEPSFKEIRKAFERKQEKLITLNVGLNPKEGKYHLSACNACFTKYSAEQANQLNWKCMKCRGAIKKGVRDRIEELADFKEETHPDFRPPYMHSLPLAEIIQAAFGVNNINSQKVQSTWMDFVERFGNEINVLVDAEEEELNEVNQEVAKKVKAFREGLVLYIPGGGGNYGKPIICDSKEEFDSRKEILEKDINASQVSGQKTLGEF